MFRTAWLVWFGCSDVRPPPETGVAPSATRDTLVIGDKSDIGTLLSILPQTWADSALTEAIGLVPIQAEFDCSIKPSPGLAKAWEWNEDGTVLAVELRDDLTWEDGVPVTADDVAFTYDLVGDPTVTSPYVSYVEHMTPDGRPKVIDATHIEWHFTHAYDRDIQTSHANLLPVPKHVFAGADRATLRGHEKANQALSYGPWRLATWEPSQRVVLEPNPEFSGPEQYRPRLNRVIYRVIPEYATRLLELESGNIDLMNDVAIADADRLRTEHPEIRLVRRGWRSMEYVGWNLQQPLFQDLRVRKALAMATDIHGMIGKLLTSKTGESYGRQAIGTITPALCGVHNEEIKPLPFDVAGARALFAQAGWADSDGDGVLDKDGKKFEFTLATTLGNKRRADASILFQDLMKQVGVSVRIEKVEVNTFFANLREHKFEAALAGWSAALFVDPSLWRCDKEGARQVSNFGGYCNPQVDTLIAKGLSTVEQREAAPIWKDVQRILYEDQAYLFLWWMDEIVGINDRFENTTIDIVSPYKNLYEWEVPADKVKHAR
jgi:peptide/nickel transport system substrate-binding protein